MQSSACTNAKDLLPIRTKIDFKIKDMFISLFFKCLAQMNPLSQHLEIC